MGHSAKSLFDQNIESAEDCLSLFDGLSQLQTNLDPSWLLRAAVVFSISALDAYFHDKVRYRAGKFDVHSLPPDLAKFSIPLGDLGKWERATRKGNVIRNWLTDYFSRRPLQRTEDISSALKLVGIVNLWATIESDSPSREALLGRMRDFVQRRNQIAHEGDRLTAKKHGKQLRPMTRVFAQDCIDFCKDLIRRIESSFPS